MGKSFRGGFCMLNVLDLVTCSGITEPIDAIVPNTVHMIVTLIQIAIPIILILFGMLDLGKAVMANEEKEMKESQKRLIKRILYAVLVFFVIAIVKWIFAAIDTNNGDDIKNCINCFIGGQCTVVSAE